MKGEGKRSFIKAFNSMAYRHDRWNLWSDWLQMAACSIYNGIHKDPKIEETYLAVAKRYTKDELELFGQLLGGLVMELEEYPRDVLGELFGELEVYNKHLGQFFTPFSIAQLCSAILSPSFDRKSGEVIKINEPTCGSGGMLIATWLNIKPEDRAWTHMIAQDLDYRCFCMCYIQLSLMGISAEVWHGDTLRYEFSKKWKTPGYYLYGMDSKLRISSILELVGDAPRISTPEPIPEPVAPELPKAIEIPAQPEIQPPAHRKRGKEQVQLSLF